LGHHAYYGGYATAFGNGYGNGTPWNDGRATSYPHYPMFGYNNGGYGFYSRGHPAFGFGVRRGSYGNGITYRRGRYY
jgi:hypothetical protein